MEAPWYFDFVSPFAYLQLQRLDTLRARLALTPVPVVPGTPFHQAGLRGTRGNSCQAHLHLPHCEQSRRIRGPGMRWPASCYFSRKIHRCVPYGRVRTCALAW